MSSPAVLNVITRPGTSADAPTVIFVHGSLDRGESFVRVMRRMPEATTLAYDRRGYQESREAGVVGLGGHINDLLAIAEEAHEQGGGTVVALGHSFGGDVVVGAALSDPHVFGAIGAYEPPMPWLGFRRPEGPAGPAGPVGPPGPANRRPVLEDPAEEVEDFFSRMVSPAAWARLTEEGRESRRADGPALVADLRSIHAEDMPFDVERLKVPSVFGMGGAETRLHHRRSVQWLGSNVPGAEVYEIEGARHGSHLSHPDHFANMARRVIERARESQPGS
jgi:pimeloyl-ACP methyl ester carboxylesterase